MKKNIWRGLCFLFAPMILLGSTAGSVLEANRNVVDGYLGTKSYTVVSEAANELYTTFTADYENTDALVAAHQAMGEMLMEEGAVLLKNSGSLPLQESARSVTLLGIRADANTLYGATVGVSVPAGQNVSLTQALEERGFSVNGTVNAAYGKIKDKGYNKLSPSFSGVLPGQEPAYAVLEPSVEDLTAVDAGFTDSMQQYHDAAIVVLGRPGSEAADYYPGATGIDPASGARNPLALTDAERSLLAFAEENFETVIVLINAANAMELRELQEDEGVSAILWIGWPGNYGMRGVADILTGAVNPSGALPDIYASDSTSAPAMANYGVITWANAAGNLDTAVDRGDYYLIEAEGIYTGYRYYETRYADKVMGDSGAASEVGSSYEGGWEYAREMCYPFGYGLSYTDFEYSALKIKTTKHSVVITFNIRNSGSSSGRKAFGIYVSAPAGGLDKPSRELKAFGKTGMLAPGESEPVRIEIPLSRLASYNEKAGEWQTARGQYTLYVGANVEKPCLMGKFRKI